MIDTSWLKAASGGAMIGLASGGLMLLNGRIAGISGIFHRAAEGSRESWRWAFLLGLIGAGFAFHWLYGVPSTGNLASAPFASYLNALLAGLLVGFGTRMGNMTRTLPKPLISVAGCPLVDHALDLCRTEM